MFNFVCSCLIYSLHSRPSSLSRASGALMLPYFSFLIQKWERFLLQSGPNHHFHWVLWLIFVCFCHLHLCKPLPLTTIRWLAEQGFILWETFWGKVCCIGNYISVQTTNKSWIFRFLSLNPVRQSLNCCKQAEMVKSQSAGLQLLSLADTKVFILFSQWPSVR